MIRFDIITLFPQLFENHLKELPFKKAISSGIAEYKLWNLRDYAIDKHGTVDDKPYGGGVGMLLMIEPLYKALQDIIGDTIPENTKVVLMSPKGSRYTQKTAQEYKNIEHIVLICGRYEGVDARIDEYITDKVSIGDFVLSGGELPALVVMESITRLLPGILEKEGATEIESFSNGQLEFPQYTRPEEFNGSKVPPVLLSGNHAEIEKWREEHTKELEQ